MKFEGGSNSKYAAKHSFLAFGLSAWSGWGSVASELLQRTRVMLIYEPPEFYASQKELSNFVQTLFRISFEFYAVLRRDSKSI